MSPPPPSCTIGLFDPAYPPRLRELKHPPDLLRVRGALPGGRAVAIVGTRDASREGEAFARYLAGSLARLQVSVWSGGARGIDRAAHEGALDADGVTVLVSGAGIDVPYPASSSDLYRLAPLRGAVVSLSPDAATPRAFSLLARNEVLAVLTDATVIVECPLKSGARSTSAAARRCGRPVFIAAQPPWSRFAVTVSEEQRLGARVFTDIEALLRDLVPPRDLPALSPAAERTAAGLAGGPLSVDDLCETLGMSAADVAVCLTELTLAGRVQAAGAGRYVLT